MPSSNHWVCVYNWTPVSLLPRVCRVCMWKRKVRKHKRTLHENCISFRYTIKTSNPGDFVFQLWCSDDSGALFFHSLSPCSFNHTTSGAKCVRLFGSLRVFAHCTQLHSCFHLWQRFPNGNEQIAIQIVIKYNITVHIVRYIRYSEFRLDPCVYKLWAVNNCCWFCYCLLCFIVLCIQTDILLEFNELWE